MQKKTFRFLALIFSELSAGLRKLQSPYFCGKLAGLLVGSPKVGPGSISVASCTTGLYARRGGIALRMSIPPKVHRPESSVTEHQCVSVRALKPPARSRIDSAPFRGGAIQRVEPLSAGFVVP